MISLDSAIKALYSIRCEDTFTSIEIKNYLYNHLEYLLDYDNHSFISNYVII